MRNSIYPILKRASTKFVGGIFIFCMPLNSVRAVDPAKALMATVAAKDSLSNVRTELALATSENDRSGFCRKLLGTMGRLLGRRSRADRVGTHLNEAAMWAKDANNFLSQAVRAWSGSDGDRDIQPIWDILDSEGKTAFTSRPFLPVRLYEFKGSGFAQETIEHAISMGLNLLITKESNGLFLHINLAAPTLSSLAMSGITQSQTSELSDKAISQEAALETSSGQLRPVGSFPIRVNPNLDLASYGTLVLEAEFSGNQILGALLHPYTGTHEPRYKDKPFKIQIIVKSSDDEDSSILVDLQLLEPNPAKSSDNPSEWVVTRIPLAD